MKKALILTGGDAPATLEFSASGYYVIAADSGLELAKRYGIEPDVYVGDTDSLRKLKLLQTIPESRKHFFDCNKAYTDTELALQHAHSKNCTDISIVGGGGGREDHFLAILSLFNYDPCLRAWHTAMSHMECIDLSCSIKGYENTQVSFFLLGPEPCKAETSGLQWDLGATPLQRNYFSVSNIIISNVCKIYIQKGRLLMILNRDLEKKNNLHLLRKSIENQARSRN